MSRFAPEEGLEVGTARMSVVPGATLDRAELSPMRMPRFESSMVMVLLDEPFQVRLPPFMVRDCPAKVRAVPSGGVRGRKPKVS